MKSNLTIKLPVGLCALALAFTAHATDRIKANNTTALNVAGSWTNGLPTASDLTVFDSTLDAVAKSYGLGGNLTVNGISFRDAQSAQTITNTTSATLTFANGSPGVDMTPAATADLTIGCVLNLGSSGGQTLNVANAGRTLLINAAISGTGPLSKTGPGLFKSSNNGHTYTGGTVISGGTLQLGVNNGLAAGNVFATNGGTLDLNSLGLTNKAGYIIHISGSGVGGNGALVNNGSSQLNFALTNLVLDADALIGGSQRFDLRPITASALAPSVDLAGHTLTKVGANVIFFQQLSSLSDGNIVVQNGTLALNGTPMTGNGLVTVKNTAELRLFRNAAANTISTVTRPITLEGGSLVAYTGTDTSDAIDQSVGSSIALTGDTTVSVATAGAVFELAGVMSGVGGVTKTGAGILLLSGADTNSGNMLVSAGTLSLSSLWKGSGNVTVNDSGTLEVREAAVNSSLRLNSLAFGSAAGPTTNAFDLGGFANPALPVIVVTNGLNLTGTTFINLTGTSGLTNGTFKLISFGSISGTGSLQIGLAAGGNATLATNGNTIEVTFLPVTLSWRGETNGVPLADWATGGTTNWFNSLLNARAVYADGNGVIFSDSLTGTPAVNLPATVVPSSVIISNTVTDYTFAGAGKISGTTSIAKTGAGKATLGTINDYSGATVVSQGTLQLGVAEAIPSAGLSPAISVNGTLDLNGFNQTVTGLNGNGVLDNATGSAATLTIAGGGTFSGSIQNSGGPGAFALKKTGSQPLVLSGASTFSGGSVIQGPILAGSDLALGSGQIAISFVGALSSASATPRTFTNSLKLDGANVPVLGDTANNGLLTFTGPITMNGGNRTIFLNSDVVFQSGVDTGVNLAKQGPGKLTLNGANTYTGTTTVSGGTLAGTGTISGPVTIGAATLAPGHNGIGTLTINNNLSLGGGSTVRFELNSASAATDSIQGLAGLSYNGTLDVTNLASSATLTSGQTFQLFSSGATPTGNFSATNLPSLPGGLAWNWSPSSGILSVVTGTATTPTNIVVSYSGNQLSLSWPASHLGWFAQTNSANISDPNAWFDVPGSETATNLTVSISPSATNVFYRLRKP